MTRADIMGAAGDTADAAHDAIERRLAAARLRRAMNLPRSTAAPAQRTDKAEAERKARNRAAFTQGLREGVEGPSTSTATPDASKAEADKKAAARAAFRRGLRGEG